MFFEAVPLHPSCSNCSSSWSVSYLDCCISFLSQIHSLHSIQKMFVIQELDFRVGKALISTLKEDQVIPALNSLLASYCICDKVEASSISIPEPLWSDAYLGLLTSHPLHLHTWPHIALQCSLKTFYSSLECVGLSLRCSLLKIFLQHLLLQSSTACSSSL